MNDATMAENAAEAHRIQIAWGIEPLEVSENDKLCRLDAEDRTNRCRWERQDGYACFGEAFADDVCHRHDGALHEELVEHLQGMNQILRQVTQAKARSGGSWRRGVYLITAAGNVKIGKSDDVDGRMRSLQCGSPVPLTMARFIHTTDPGALERWMHKRYAEHRLHGEWFNALPVMADVAQYPDDWFRAHADSALRLAGPAQQLARFFGTNDGRFALANLDLDVVVSERPTLLAAA